MNPILAEAMQHRVYPITKRIAIGQFATENRASHLLQRGVTHIVNVGEAASVVKVSAEGFRQIVDHPIVDFSRIPDKIAVSCLDTLHKMLTQSHVEVYLHCIACQNRSPTILWLYLIACGLDGVEAKQMITVRCPDAVPGHNQLVDAELIELAQSHGKQHFIPLTDSAILEPAY